MTENNADNLPAWACLADVADAELFRYVSRKNLLRTSSVMRRRARELRPPILAWLRCVCFEWRTGQEVAGELTQRMAAKSQQHAAARITASNQSA